MKEYLLNPEKTQIGKLSNVGLALLLVLAHLFIVVGVQALLTGTPIKLGGLPGYNPPYSLWLTLVIAPLWEELVFRVAPIKLAQVFGPDTLWPIILISSALFGWGHGGVEGLIFQGVMGVIFCVLYIKNNYSYWHNVLFHGLWNLFATITL